MNSYTIGNGKSRSFTAPLSYQVIDLETEPHRLAELSLSALRELDVDAIVVRHFLSATEVETLLQHLLQQPENQGPITQSKTYPFPFAASDKSNPNRANEINAYFLQCKMYRDEYPTRFGVDIEKKTTDILTRLNQNQPAKIQTTANGGSYIPSTFRMAIPEQTYIDLHADNMFPQFATEFYEPLRQVAEVHNQLSFFTILQKPERGGELSLFNVAWDVAKEFNTTEQSIILENGQRLQAGNANELYRHQFDLEPGDLIIFPGGQLYHRIEDVQGSKLRISLGGFIGYSKANKDVYYWS